MKIYGFGSTRDEHLKKTKGKQSILKAMLLSHLLSLASRALGDGLEPFVEALIEKTFKTLRKSMNSDGEATESIVKRRQNIWFYDGNTSAGGLEAKRIGKPSENPWFGIN